MADFVQLLVIGLLAGGIYVAVGVGLALLRKRGYRVLELRYDNYSGRQRDQLYDEILDNLGMI